MYKSYNGGKEREGLCHFNIPFEFASLILLCLKTGATILFLYFIGLFLQPTILPLYHASKGVQSCCAKSEKNNKHNGCSKEKSCCDDGSCNPFFSQCPMCAANAVVTTPFFVVQVKQQYYAQVKFGTYQQYLTNQYEGDILRPPQVVCS